jgi:hypothetical protein
MIRRAAASLLPSLKIALTGLFVVPSGCSNAPSTDASPRSSTSANSMITNVSAVSATSAAPVSSWGPFPKAARRDSPPPGMADRAAASGARAPLFSLPGVKEAWSLEAALGQSRQVVLIFFRGAW